jgi:hypothetical protein
MSDEGYGQRLCEWPGISMSELRSDSAGTS